MCDRENRIKARKDWKKTSGLFLIPKYTVEAVGGRFSCILQMQIREKNMPFYEEWIRESELQIKVFDCTQRAVIGWKGKEK